MIAQELLESRRAKLQDTIQASLEAGDDSAVHVLAFAIRLLGMQRINKLVPSYRFQISDDPEMVRYDGYPSVAALGFCLAAGVLSTDVATGPFLAGLRALQQRRQEGLTNLAADDVALLGIADGLSSLRNQENNSNAEFDTWLSILIGGQSSSGQWSERMRALAGDMLDDRGRLRLSPVSNTDNLAVEYALRAAYPRLFRNTAGPSADVSKTLLRALLTDRVPSRGELDRLVVWFAALDNIIDAAASSLVPSTSDTAKLLERIRDSFKRWPWKEKSLRKKTAPARWLIDSEYDVQSLLWAILYPVYGADLVDEEYLPSLGNVQPRADLGIVKLKLIIEVKHARNPAFFRDIEEQVAGDIGLYFVDTSRFDRMIVFVYDDSDTPQPERYGALRNALIGRKEIEDVIIVQRPSMIPRRGNRGVSAVTTSADSKALSEEEDGDE